MTLTNAEIGYLETQSLGRLATIQADGSPQVKPVGFRYHPEPGTIDVSGFRMSASQKFRNVSRDGRVALVVDDIASVQPWRVRFLEIRGVAACVVDPSCPTTAQCSAFRVVRGPRYCAAGSVKP